MGCVESNDKSDYLDSSRLSSIKPARNEFKLLLLGPGGVGKTTFRKQLQTIHGNGYCIEERMAYREIIRANIVRQMLTIIDLILDSYDPYDLDVCEFKLTEAGNKCANYILSVCDDPMTCLENNNKLVENIQELWQESAVLEVYEQRARFGIVDDASSYFFNNVADISLPTYVPSINVCIYTCIFRCLSCFQICQYLVGNVA